MSDLVVTEIASSSANGALVADVSGINLAYVAATHPDQLVQYMNADLMAAQHGLPEGTRVEIVITGWQAFGQNWAERVAQGIQDAYVKGDITDPDTGNRVEAWPEYPDQICWGDNEANTVTMRSVKQFPIMVVVWVVIGILAIIGVWKLWELLHQSQWSARSATPQVTTNPGGSTGLPSAGTVFSWAWNNWHWVLLGAGALAATPFIVRTVAKTREAKNELAAAERGEY
jgi:hypothetical protein